MSYNARSNLGPCPPRNSAVVAETHFTMYRRPGFPEWVSADYADWQRKRAEKAEALLAEAYKLLANACQGVEMLSWLDAQEALLLRIAAHLAEVGES